MELFFDNLKRQEAVTLSSVRKAALASLPVDCGNAPWRYTERGKVVYETEEQLDCYLASYTRWHEGKLRKAFDMIPLGAFAGEISVIDWGCGQGLGTICLLEYLLDNVSHAGFMRLSLLSHPWLRSEERESYCD